MRTVGQLREEIMGKSLTDPAFRQRLLDDPVAALREDIGVNLPDGFKVHVHEEVSADQAHIVIPPANLSAEEMAQAAAGNCDGTSHYMWDC